jgi:hypothetical protein
VGHQIIYHDIRGSFTPYNNVNINTTATSPPALPRLNPDGERDPQQAAVPGQ